MGSFDTPRRKPNNRNQASRNSTRSNNPTTPLPAAKSASSGRPLGYSAGSSTLAAWQTTDDDSATRTARANTRLPSQSRTLDSSPADQVQTPLAGGSHANTNCRQSRNTTAPPAAAGRSYHDSCRPEEPYQAALIPTTDGTRDVSALPRPQTHVHPHAHKPRKHLSAASYLVPRQRSLRGGGGSGPSSSPASLVPPAGLDIVCHSLSPVTRPRAAAGSRTALPPPKPQPSCFFAVRYSKRRRQSKRVFGVRPNSCPCISVAVSSHGDWVSWSSAESNTWA